MSTVNLRLIIKLLYTVYKFESFRVEPHSVVLLDYTCI